MNIMMDIEDAFEQLYKEQADAIKESPEINARILHIPRLKR